MVNRWGSFKKIFISRKIVENPFGLVEAFGKGEKKVFRRGDRLGASTFRSIELSAQMPTRPCVRVTRQPNEPRL